MAVKKEIKVTRSTREGGKSFPVILSAKYFTNELGRFVSPSLAFISHCHSVIGQ